MPIIISGGGGSAPLEGSVAWSNVTGKPTVVTAVGNPGSDADTVSEQAVRESLTSASRGKIVFFAESVTATEYPITNDLPAGTVVKAVHNTTSGSAEFTVKLAGVNVTGLAGLTVDSSETSNTATAANTATEGTAMSISFTNIISAVNVMITITYDKTIT